MEEKERSDHRKGKEDPQDRDGPDLQGEDAPVGEKEKLALEGIYG